MFTSGIGITYAPSAITASPPTPATPSPPSVSTPAPATPSALSHPAASSLILGQRMLPQTLVRAADARPYELHDLLPADARWKLLVFTGDTGDSAQLAKVGALAREMEGFLERYEGAGTGRGEVFDLWSVSSARKEDVDYTDLPGLFRSHWSKCVSPPPLPLS